MNARWAKFVASITACLFLASCAQIGPPIPPSLELPNPPGDLHAARKGNAVTLTWSEPTRTTDRRLVRYLGPTRLCRSLEADITSCESAIAELGPPRTPQPKDSKPQIQTYVDHISRALGEQNPSGQVTYALEVFNQDRRSAGLSNRAHVPAVPTLPPPSHVNPELMEDGVVLTWQAVSPQPFPEVQYRYRAYRRDEATGKDTVAGEIAVEGAEPVRFMDTSFEWERTYSYRVTVVSIVTHEGQESQVEGDDSPPVRVVAHDVFPPAVPGGLQAVNSVENGKNFVDLVWAPVSSADLAGYNIYRRETNGSSTKLNADLVKGPAYRDASVVPGTTYSYSVSAVDVRGNESSRSEDATETVPAAQ